MYTVQYQTQIQGVGHENYVSPLNIFKKKDLY